MVMCKFHSHSHFPRVKLFLIFWLKIALRPCFAIPVILANYVSSFFFQFSNRGYGTIIEKHLLTLTGSKWRAVLVKIEIFKFGFCSFHLLCGENSFCEAIWTFLIYQISSITNKCQYLQIQRVNFTYKDETEPFNNKTRLWSDNNAIKRQLSPKCTECKWFFALYQGLDTQTCFAMIVSVFQRTLSNISSHETNEQVQSVELF